MHLCWSNQELKQLLAILQAYDDADASKLAEKVRAEINHGRVPHPHSPECSEQIKEQIMLITKWRIEKEVALQPEDVGLRTERDGLRTWVVVADGFETEDEATLQFADAAKYPLDFKYRVVSYDIAVTPPIGIPGKYPTRAEA